MNLRILFTLLACGIALGRLPAQNDAPPSPSEPPPPSPLHGDIQGDVYFSPTGAFRVNIPVLPELGGTVTDSANVVTFSDDIDIYASIAAFPMTREQKWEFETRGVQEYLTYFFGNFILPDFTSRFAGAKVETVSFLPKYQGGTLETGVLLPGGSSFNDQLPLFGQEAPPVAKRGFFCFAKHDHLFVLSTELAERMLQPSTYKKTADEESVILRRRLQELVAKMVFLEPANPPK